MNLKPLALVVEDNDCVRIAETLLLEDEGFDVISASDGNEAIDLLKNAADDLDVVVTDYHLAEKNGLEISKKVAEVAPGTPVVLVSSEAGVLQKASGSLFSAVIAKPFQADNFTNTIVSVSS